MFRVQSPPPLSSPADAGEDEGGGLNGAQRLNGLNLLNQQLVDRTLNSYLRFRHSRVGSSSGSGVSCGGRNPSGTFRRFTRMRVQVDDLPRMESISTSSTARSVATSGCLLFHLSRPATAASLSGEFATTRSGALVRGFFTVGFFTAERAREGATRGASPSILRKCGGQGASPRPDASSSAASPSSFSCDPWRSDCSRGTRRDAPPSTSSSWPGPVDAARLRAITQARRGAPD